MSNFSNRPAVSCDRGPTLPVGTRRRLEGPECSRSLQSSAQLGDSRDWIFQVSECSCKAVLGVYLGNPPGVERKEDKHRHLSKNFSQAECLFVMRGEGKCSRSCLCDEREAVCLNTTGTGDHRTKCSFSQPGGEWRGYIIHLIHDVYHIPSGTSSVLKSCTGNRNNKI